MEPDSFVASASATRSDPGAASPLDAQRCDGKRYRFGPYLLDAGRMALFKRGERVDIQTKPLLLLQYLVQNSDRLVPRAELVDAVWPDVCVTMGSLKTAIHVLRRSLADKELSSCFISTVRGHGYRLTVPVCVDTPSRAYASTRLDTLDHGPSASTAPIHDAGFDAKYGRVSSLEDVFEDARDRHRRILLFSGLDPSAKCRVVEALLREASRLGFESHIGRTHDQGGAPPMWPWIQILRSLAQTRPLGSLDAASRDAASELTCFVPELDLHASVSIDEPSRTRAEARFARLDAIARLLSATAAIQPLLLILDDLDQIDAESLEPLTFIARYCLRAALLIVVLSGRSDAALLEWNPKLAMLLGPDRSSLVRSAPRFGASSRAEPSSTIPRHGDTESGGVHRPIELTRLAS